MDAEKQDLKLADFYASLSKEDEKLVDAAVEKTLAQYGEVLAALSGESMIRSSGAGTKG